MLFQCHKIILSLFFTFGFSLDFLCFILRDQKRGNVDRKLDGWQILAELMEI